jgi:hypothetical protein
VIPTQNKGFSVADSKPLSVDEGSNNSNMRRFSGLEGRNESVIYWTLTALVLYLILFVIIIYFLLFLTSKRIFHLTEKGK